MSVCCYCWFNDDPVQFDCPRPSGEVLAASHWSSDGWVWLDCLTIVIMWAWHWSCDHYILIFLVTILLFWIINYLLNSYVILYLCNSLPAGKDYSLLHQAPIVALFVLDHIGLPHPSLFEVDNQVVPRKFPFFTRMRVWRLRLHHSLQYTMYILDVEYLQQCHGGVGYCRY